MGGFGSGTWYRRDSKRKIEECRRLDARQLARAGYLSPSRTARRWTWTSESGTNVITIWTRPELLTLTYRVRTNGAEWHDVEDTIRLTWTACNFGGQRPWFLCPGIESGGSCLRRVAILYCADRYLLCRSCYQLAYSSQSEDRLGRALRRATKIRRRLGGGAGIVGPFPPKPKGMHSRTYLRLQNTLWDAEDESMYALVLLFDRMNPFLPAWLRVPR